MTDPAADLGRYDRQVLLPQIGAAGQRRLRHTAVTLVGCGALGSHVADLIVRAGIGALRIIDRDVLELSNLQRQTLFDEHDLSAGLPKAEAAARKLRRINSAVELTGVVADLTPRNAEELCAGADLLLDGTDNLETRYLVNDVAVAGGVPWVYAACVGTEGRVMGIVPRQTACLRCIWETPPAPGTVPTCDTQGILGATVALVASLEAVEALKIVLGRTEELSGLLAAELWTGRVQRIRAPRNAPAASRTEPERERGAREGEALAEPGAGCPCCVRGDYEFLRGARGSSAIMLCGRDAVQVTPAEPVTVDFRRIAGRLPAAARAQRSEYLLRFQAEGCTVSVFADGRAIVQGTADPAVARAVLARYVGQ